MGQAASDRDSARHPIERPKLDPVIPPGLDIYRVGKAYSLTEAARLARTSPATVRRWLQGYAQPGHQMVPVFGPAKPADGQPLMVSFVELIEIVVVARFRKGAATSRPLSLDRLRRAHRYAREALGVAYPYASLKLKEYGGHVLHEFEALEGEGPWLMALDAHGQWVLPGLVQQELEQNIDFNGEFAERWYPRGRMAHLVVDPHVAAGRVTIEGRGVTVDTVRHRWRAGEPIQSIAADYDLEPEAVEEILQLAA